MILIPKLLSFLKYQKQRFYKTPRYLLTKRVTAFLKTPGITTPLSTKEREQILKFLRRHLIDVFNYPFVDKYLWRQVKIKPDETNGLYYVHTDENRRLYFKRGMTKQDVRNMYNSLCMEQDERSPHNYCFDDLTVGAHAVVADIGAAEGNFSLKFIDKIKKLYLFESDANWMEALEATFRPWKKKVVIVNKCVSAYDDDTCISLNTFFQNKEKPTLLKLDVEGAEYEVISGWGRGFV
jgi:hypothetical protein